MFKFLGIRRKQEIYTLSGRFKAFLSLYSKLGKKTGLNWQVPVTVGAPRAGSLLLLPSTTTNTHALVLLGEMHSQPKPCGAVRTLPGPI
jgi:hypothetical protein